MVDKWTAGRFDHYRSRITSLETQNAQLTAQLEAAQLAIIKLQDEIQSLFKEKEMVVSELAEARDEVERLKGEAKANLARQVAQWEKSGWEGDEAGTGLDAEDHGPHDPTPGGEEACECPVEGHSCGKEDLAATEEE